MKKFLAGCAVIVVLGCIATAVALYMGYRAAKPMIDSARSGITNLGELAKSDEKIANKAKYAAPDNHELTDAQVARYVAVQEQVRKQLGAKWDDLVAKANGFQKKQDAEHRDLTFSEATALLSDFGSLFVEARRAQVDALNAQQFSSDEYTWVKHRVYEAAGLDLAGALNLKALTEIARKQAEEAGAPAPEIKLPEAPEKNKALVKPHLEKLKDWLPLAMMGL
jgi:hypothetical protein